MRISSVGYVLSSPFLPSTFQTRSSQLAQGVPPNISPHHQNFRGQHGKAYLFNNVVNVVAGDASERNMTTGKHIVRDIACRQCNETVGWKYDKAYEASEKYKEGKFILEAELLCNVT
ncbi:yippee zinc-binding/DNA-binding /Mis18, centromere assembly-domain-containing protein [Rhexocercosporidium sp. MPI-PUGE-AT-0058]|nr:yippee zinc-binding/DNA-binding /Mis18, centromere assembly-domain-containing protein [Rhexocercosporidium sp. MPI-PUGE-AT-0058]